MINIFRRNKWRISYVDKIGTPEKVVIITAKTIEQAKKEFHKVFADKTITSIFTHF